MRITKNQNVEQNANQNQRPENIRVDSSHPWVIDKKKNGIDAEMPEMEGKNRAAVKKKSHVENGWAPAMSLARSKTPKRICSMMKIGENDKMHESRSPSRT